MNSLPSRWPAERLQSWAQKVLVAAGLPQGDASTVASCLVENSLRGVDGHGLSRLQIYTKRLRLGLVNPRPQFSILKSGPAVLLLDGDNGQGIVVAVHAMRLCIEKAREAGAAFVAVRNANHFATCAYYTMMATAADMIGLATCNSEPNMAPWGSITPYLSNYPISFAVPGGEEGDVVLDMATSTVAWGRVQQAALRGEQIPAGWAVDRKGREIRDPVEAVKGMMVPLGGYKGSGLALIISLLTGVLTGASFGSKVGAMYYDFEHKQDLSFLFAAIDVAYFLPVAEFKRRVDQTIREIHACELAEGFSRIYVPGEMEAETKRERERLGIPLPEGLVTELKELGDEVGVALPT